MKLSATSSILKRHYAFQPLLLLQCRSQAQPYSSATTSSSSTIPVQASLKTPINEKTKLPCLSLMPTTLLLRSYFLTSILASPSILKICLPLINKIANSNSRLLNPDRNPVLHFLIRKLFYDHFSAGETEVEVKNSIAAMKRLGFKGVILGYAKEVNVTGGPVKQDVSISSDVGVSEACIEAWREGTFKTLNLIGEGDYLGVKFSGAGPSTLNALATQKSPIPAMWSAMHDICALAAQQNKRLWIDAEQQDLQLTIEAWTIDLMRKYNHNGKALVSTTMQAYLKSTSDHILEHLKIAQQEGWTLGVKLVRGAYIATERRGLIHDTIEDTHQAYDSIAKALLTQSFPGVPSDKPYPHSALFIATHNDASIKKAYEIQKSLILAGKPTIEIGYGQLQGMADEVSCGLLQLCQAAQPGETDARKLALSPHAFKCLTWGTTQECLQFLLRRVRENKDALGRTEYWAAGFRQELLRRVKVVFKLA